MLTVFMAVPERFAHIVNCESTRLMITPDRYVEQFVIPMISDDHRFLCLQVGSML
jgi:hypothetical protein